MSGTRPGPECCEEANSRSSYSVGRKRRWWQQGLDGMRGKPSRGSHIWVSWGDVEAEVLGWKRKNLVWVEHRQGINQSWWLLPSWVREGSSGEILMKTEWLEGLIWVGVGVPGGGRSTKAHSLGWLLCLTVTAFSGCLFGWLYLRSKSQQFCLGVRMKGVHFLEKYDLKTQCFVLDGHLRHESLYLNLPDFLREFLKDNKTISKYSEFS